MMQRNEVALLPLWLRHHGLLFGLPNLCVIDNGSDDPAVLATLRSAEARGVHIIRGHMTPADFAAKGEIVSDIIRGWDRDADYDLAIPLDCDEFVGVLTDRLALDRESILAACAAVCREQGTFLTNRVLLNIPLRPGYFLPQSIQRGLFRAGTIVTLDHGFHAPVSTMPERWVQTPFVYFHMHNRPDFEAIRAFARQKLYHLTGGDDRRLAEDRAEGAHLAHYFRTTGEAFEASYRGRPDIYMPGFVPYLTELAIDPEPVLGSGGIVLHAAPPEGYLVHKSDPDERRHVFDRFDADWYARENLDVATDNFFGIWPLLHFIMHGWDEGRRPHPPGLAPIVIEQG
ncbi:glycosyltransferase family 2 protein [Tanticharoenia sakaeratensis]|uniref:Uncharacterized protein n=1 Tax=Tanticharoenia sakaeratensis NBRC 103193 TaxID=1231623 RepID=A0A0D6ML31_9PROT|nr:glycosyltransferase family 2 protein [Tanticharoenia sakaeratensis]GAN53983.1 hypothetical protein Tasa_014_004 [Tanticharoenia sakaeratensis NBRC 103193]GBQ23030.1 hypothetical protein AA103193_2270 [Tanticharoenia sakaeratensis NBRC 103193]